MMQDSAHNLLAIVNDILDLEKIEAGKMQMEEIPFNVPEKINSIVHSFSFKAEEKGIRLTHTNGLPASLQVKGDPYRLVQILNNFLSNAVKFTEKGSITVSSKVKVDKEEWLAIECVIQDTGIGIPADKLKAIFSPFVQASSSTTRKYGGTGLGLSICKNLIEMQGGELWVESTVDTGTSFRFIIPYKKEEAIVMETATVSVTNYASLGKRHVLLAEDVELNQFLARHIMESWGFTVTIADNGKKAVEMLQQQPFDLILMDIQMPEMDGIAATQHIRQLADQAKASIPIVALTANALKGDSDTYMSAGMNDYLSKPFTEANLFEVIRKNLPAQGSATNAEATQAQSPAIIKENTVMSLYDLSMVRSVSGGDEAFIKKMVQLFIETVPPGLKDLNEACSKGEWQRVGKVAHKLKSTIDSMGITVVKDDIRLIENNGKHEIDTAGLASLSDKVSAVIYDCIAQLKTDFAL